MGGRKHRVRPTVDFSEIKKMKANGRYAIGVPKSKNICPIWQSIKAAASLSFSS